LGSNPQLTAFEARTLTIDVVTNISQEVIIKTYEQKWIHKSH